MIERVAVVGAGAVGASLVAMMLDAGTEVAVIARGERARRLERDGLRVNGVRYRPPLDEEPWENPYDLVLVATKSTQLESALPQVVSAAGESGLVVSLLNGISSESILRDALGPGAERRVVPAMILGIDAVRGADGVRYLNRGIIHYGSEAERAPVSAGSLDELGAVFAASGIPARRAEDIRRTLWWKFMINVGINQASAVLRAPYGLFQESKDARALMVDAMEEVLALSEREGVGLSADDVSAWLRTLDGLDPGGKTSMLQDVEAGRPTEVDLFAGTVVGMALRYGVDVPVNRTLLRIIRALEASMRPTDQEVS